ncbi:MULTISPECIES: STAS domain-containing protein [Streptomyces]|uniref:Anti-sigma factor antagonist n=1 Tax=Streptomyces lasalocidi TaxID=324833 RepID=A0A4V6AUI9_STRLS|nr:STAS domain-containing protein [Streptomyces lasalocidi]TKS96142.1 STAS domain-containing protein [Streptomyces lasalocidi]
MTHTDNADQTVRLCAEPRTVDGTCVVSLRGQIDYDAKEQLRQALRTEDAAGQPRIVADLSEVTFMDSSGINVFVATHQQVSQAGGWVRIAAAQEPVLRVLQLVGIDTLIPCHPTLEQALAD